MNRTQKAIDRNVQNLNKTDQKEALCDYTGMNKALFHILCELKKSKKSESPSKEGEKEINENALKMKDPQHQRLDRCLGNEGIFRRGSNLFDAKR